MTENQNKQLSRILWSNMDELRECMDEYGLQNYMLAFLLLHYLSDNYEQIAIEELGNDFSDLWEADKNGVASLSDWYEQNPNDHLVFEEKMRTKSYYIIQPEHLWRNIVSMAHNHSTDLLNTLESSFKYIENESFRSNFTDLFSAIDLNSYHLGKTYEDRNSKLCHIITKISKILTELSKNLDDLAEVFEFLIDQFAAVTYKKYKEFYTPRGISDILSAVVAHDFCQGDYKGDKKMHLPKIFDFACGTGSLLLNVRKSMGSHAMDKIYGQEKDTTIYNLARMNMLIHGMKDMNFEIYHGDSLINEWSILHETNLQENLFFDAIVAHLPVISRWESEDPLSHNMRFKDYKLATRSYACLFFLLHGFYYLKEDGVMVITLSGGALVRDGSEAKIRRKLLDEGSIETVIGLPGNLLYSSGTPPYILVLKKNRTSNDVLFISAFEHYEKGLRQNHLSDEHIDKIIDAYKERPRRVPQYARLVKLSEIKANDYSLDPTRYVSMAESEIPVDLGDIQKQVSHLNFVHLLDLTGFLQIDKLFRD